VAAAGRCKKGGCNSSVHIGKEYCLDHYKEQDDYSYGLDADLKKKMAAKFDPTKAAQAQAWIEALTRVRCDGEFQEYLKSGVILCNAVNAIKAGSVRAINRPGMPFKERENIAAYLSACKTFGARDTDLFMTQDLYENANMNVVIDNIHALGSLSRKVAGFNGPFLGVKMADENKRNFSDEQLKSSAGTRQTQGSYGFQVEKSPGLDKIIKNVDALEANRGANVAKCGNCGAKRDAGKFCASCGNKYD